MLHIIQCTHICCLSFPYYCIYYIYSLWFHLLIPSNDWCMQSLHQALINCSFIPIILFSYSKKNFTYYSFQATHYSLYPIIPQFQCIMESGQNDIHTLHFYTMSKQYMYHYQNAFSGSEVINDYRNVDPWSYYGSDIIL